MNDITVDSPAALRYVEALAGDVLPRPLIIAEMADEKIQPTVGALAGSLLDVIVRAHRPARILEVGTSLGYAACILGHAAASYGGRVISLEINPRIADAARLNVEAQGLGDTVDVITADAAVWLREHAVRFGLILQDGAKNYLDYLERTVELLEPCGLLVTDDILFPVMENVPSQWKAMIDEHNRALRAHPRLRTAWLPIGDGVSISVKVG